MSNSHAQSRRFGWFLFPAAVLSALIPGSCWGEDIVHIEEHWELGVGGPTPNRSAPQVTMTMSPTGDLYNDYFVVTLNHQSDPDYVPGGVQVQHWHDEDVLDSDTGSAGDVLSTEDETVRWTQRMRLVNGWIIFDVIEGTSETWGNFGGYGDLRESTYTSLSNLNGYKPAVSINESGISYAGNRVSSLVLKKLVWYTADGDRHELNAPIDIDTDLDP